MHVDHIAPPGLKLRGYVLAVARALAGIGATMTEPTPRNWRITILAIAYLLLGGLLVMAAVAPVQSVLAGFGFSEPAWRGTYALLALLTLAGVLGVFRRWSFSLGALAFVSSVVVAWDLRMWVGYPFSAELRQMFAQHGAPQNLGLTMSGGAHLVALLYFAFGGVAAHLRLSEKAKWLCLLAAAWLAIAAVAGILAYDQAGRPA